MKTHGLDFIGYIIIQRVNGLPDFNPLTDEARLIYDINNHKIYKGDDNEWNEVIDINSELLVHQYDSMPSWSASDEGRIISVDEKIYKANSLGWVELVDDDNIKLIQKYSELPEYTSNDTGRVIFNEDDEELYIGKGGDWSQMDIDPAIEYEHPTSIQCEHAIEDHSDSAGSTDARTSDSTTLLLQAKAMNDHIESGDHDGRYVKKDGDTTTGTINTSNTTYNASFRNITISTSTPSNSQGMDGDVWLKI